MGARGGEGGPALAALQDRMKRDPGLYVEDFQRELRHFEAEEALLRSSCARPNERGERRGEAERSFAKLASFMAQVSPLYLESGGRDVAPLLMRLMDERCATLHPDTRAKLAQALILLRRRGALDAESLLALCFRLFRQRDKALRSFVYAYVVRDIYAVNERRTNHALNAALQRLVFGMLADDERSAGSPAAAKRALSVVVDMYKRRVWVDERTVNVVAEACFSKIARNAVLAARFFLGVDDEIDDLVARDEDDDDVNDGDARAAAKRASSREKEVRQILKSPKVAKPTRKRARAKEKLVRELKRMSSSDAPVGAVGGRPVAARASAARRRRAAPRFPAIDLIHDPQTFCERLLTLVKSSTDRFEIRLVQLNLVSRVVGHHRLHLLPLYSFCQRYLQPHQPHVVEVLAAVIQASHALVPPEELEPLVKMLANNFVNDRVGGEAMAVGLNAVRELVARVPLLTQGEGIRDLIADLVLYRKHRRDRSVVVAARALLNLMRQINPSALPRKERGKDAVVNAPPALLEFGQEPVALPSVDSMAESDGAYEDYFLEYDDDDEEDDDEVSSEDGEGVLGEDEEGDDDGDAPPTAKRVRSSRDGGTPSFEASDDDEAGKDGDHDEEDAAADPAVLDPASLEGLRTRRLRTLEGRLESLRRQRTEHRESQRHVTNREKAKLTKDFRMVSRSTRVARKRTASLKEQQATMRKHIKGVDRKRKMLKKVRKSAG